jgi:hypothetical protein
MHSLKTRLSGPARSDRSLETGTINRQLTEGAMRKSPILAVGLALATGYLLATAPNRPSAGQPPALDPLAAPQPPAVWRYQVTIAREGNYPLLILSDTTTGHCWVCESNPHDNDDWHDFGTPAAARK